MAYSFLTLLVVNIAYPVRSREPLNAYRHFSCNFALSQNKIDWVVFISLDIKTTQPYQHLVGAVEPKWTKQYNFDVMC